MSLQDTLEQINNLDINEIDWSRIGVWPLAARIFVCLMAVVGVLVFIYFFYIQGLQSTLSQQINQEQELRNQFQTRLFQSATLEQHNNLMEKMEVDFDSLVAQLPQKTQVPGLLDDIDEKGRVSGLDIVSVKLAPEVQGEFYVTLPIEIIVVGNYHNLGAFVSGIAGMARIVTLHDFEITSGGKVGDLKMSIQARTYRSLDGEGA
ncbi:type 4a pilus biogenesis protein PilO [Eionea flava]